MAVTAAPSQTLVLRFADVGIATYASLRVVGDPARTVTWVVEVPLVLAALEELTDALPEPHGDEDQHAALERALTRSAFTSPEAESRLAYILGVLLISAPAWQLLLDCVSFPRAALFVSPSARLAAVPWALLALPTSRPDLEELVRARSEAMTRTGPEAARISWQIDDISAVTDGHRLMELADVMMAVPPNITHSPRQTTRWGDRQAAPPLLVLDPRVPGQRPDSPLGSVLGRPSEQTVLSVHFGDAMRAGSVLPDVGSPVELFRRTDADRTWLGRLLARGPSRLLFAGHASFDADGRADGAGLHLAESAPFTAADLMAAGYPIPPRVALIACASGGDYRFDEATGLVAALVLGGAQTVTATLWSLPTTAGYRRFTESGADPMAELVCAVDEAHSDPEAGRAVNRWQRAQMRRWRGGDIAANPLYWAALITFAVDGAR
ncbi:CHAT domain-containing protein [Mycolicibacterium sp. S2-37]|uniref:CHAT domain-containing protein n=1 Tax=Mycolicibacterium sp. S2-37 TaxID=2810297 RepID=UPI001A94E942|nr:CHAT domain-containing protein [Mycolicibacterium sp. S2-37]MBO0680656.1 CHAT domain-containing protein [Mycolicibacterium sp. S2-37]